MLKPHDFLVHVLYHTSFLKFYFVCKDITIIICTLSQTLKEDFVSKLSVLWAELKCFTLVETTIINIHYMETFRHAYIAI